MSVVRYRYCSAYLLKLSRDPNPQDFSEEMSGLVNILLSSGPSRKSAAVEIGGVLLYFLRKWQGLGFLKLF